MRKTILVPVEKTFCDAHLARDGSEVEATATLTLGRHAWDLCVEHDVTFGRYLVDALGVPGEAVAEPEVVPVEPEPSPTSMKPSPVAAEDERDGQEQEEQPRIICPAEWHEAQRGHDDHPVVPEQPSVMVSGDVPGYSWDDAREAVRNAGYRVVGRADDSTVLLILGEGGDRNEIKLRDAAERSIPCMDVRAPGRFRDAVRAGELVGGDPLPEPVKVGPKVMSERERNRVIRAWARENGWPNLPAQGRVPMHVRHCWDLAQQDTEGKAVAA
ncbi:hypothetical protein GO001_23815 [Streptomyces sp. NRRL B-1677]|uniref:hypothetical protein n=1 Tax=Streptomyces sp. NRRL B-1677 TaxID=2682966 RepID=UPI001892CD4E|nr:hypothetical protein [Streptomyces sp. NRRL B-1677]MBF6048206.1 hypothetical protein [Streptomyces sp. NRRL B-1677]